MNILFSNMKLGEVDMLDLLVQIEEALKFKLYYIALMVSLTIPDICGALEDPEANVGQRYKKWFDEYIADKYKGHVGPKDNGSDVTFLSDDDCYYFRCSILHQAITQHDKSSYDRILISEPSPITCHNNIVGYEDNKILQINIENFCNDMISGARNWWDTNKDDKTIQENLKKFMRRYEEGFPPYIKGIPTIT